jgi:tetratricopeptide (TPR) repeat protein
MRLIMRCTWGNVVTVGFVIALAGCSQLPGREGLPNVGLPSPHATIAAAEKKRTTAGPAPSRTAAAARTNAGTAAPDVEHALNQGRNQERSGQYDKARQVYEAALRRRPGDAMLLHRLGIVADLQKKHGEAETFFLQALEQEPRDAELLGDLGYCYYLQGKLDKAQAALAKAVALAPSVARHHNNLGLVLGHMKDYDGALEQFSATGSEADAYYNMAFVFAAQDLNDEAKGCFQEALAADPSHQRAKEALAAFEEYERAPADQRDSGTELARGNVRYVPYIEGSESGHGDQAVQPASATSQLPASRDVGRTTRTLQLQSRGLLGRHMQQQRQGNQSSAASQDPGSLIEVQPQ